MKQIPNLPNHLWKYRQGIGYSQKEVAILLGLKDQSQVCNWEKGRKVPNLINAISLAILYRKPVEFLFFPHFKQKRDYLRPLEEQWRITTNYYDKQKHNL